MIALRCITLAVLIVASVVSCRSRVAVLPASLVGTDFPEVSAADLRNPKLPRLDQKERFPFIYREASAAVANAIGKEGLRPAEYLVEVRSELGGRVLRFDLWHESVVGANYDPQTRGDPSGKCRTVRFDSVNGVVTTIHGWR